MNLSLEKLSWDSGFFGLEVGRIVVSRNNVKNISELKSLVCDSAMDLIYVFVDGTLLEAEKDAVQKILVELSGVMYDRRMRFLKRMESRSMKTQSGVGVAKRISQPLESLAYDSGVYSRFALDPKLSKFFRPMYRRWMEKELTNAQVFVWPDADAPQGMATVSAQEGLGKIGLVAVAAESRGKGIALELMAAVDDWLATNGIEECEVVTQGQNLAAQALYRKVGFKCAEQQDVWHVWGKDI